ncbi:hypothetical protein AmPhEK80_0025 [Klebsiella phage AmPh_EK80]|uniref:Uncharacterized protein n=1 Tax=Klebsiella phage AmPh_EK80 TaxID=2653643 RepID=A0A5P8PKY4_9CAUD|nr:hypothetical protein AmPhEK80_0025 [Klebsiella phage AmPh_EK80]
MAKKRVVVNFLEQDSGDCEYGCWNTGYGVEVMVDGKCVHRQEAWASCTNNSSVDFDVLAHVLQGIKTKEGYPVNADHIDFGDPSDYPEEFLDLFT